MSIRPLNIIKKTVGFLLIPALMSCGEARPKTSIENFGVHEIVVISKSEFQSRIVNQIAVDALMRSEEIFCDMTPKALALYDYEDRENTKKLVPQSRAGYREVSVMPFYLKGLVEINTSKYPSLQSLVAKNSILQHEIGHLILTAEFPQTPTSSSTYGSSLPDWIDEMVALLHDDPEKMMMRKFHFLKLARQNQIIAPSSLLSLTRGNDPFELHSRHPDDPLKVLQLSGGEEQDLRSATAQALPIEDYYSQLGMLLIYLKEEHGEDCLVDNFIIAGKESLGALSLGKGYNYSDLGGSQLGLDRDYKRWLQGQIARVGK